jgi:hypothetical protein
VVLITLGLSGCVAGPLIRDTGTITYIDIEGGFYAIIGSDEYDPLNLPQEFCVEGLQVCFTGLKYHGYTYHMWGTPLVLLKIEQVNAS